jgi:hypothetical protein
MEANTTLPVDLLGYDMVDPRLPPAVGEGQHLGVQLGHLFGWDLVDHNQPPHREAAQRARFMRAM